MIIETCLIIMAVTHVAMAISLFVVFFKAKDAVQEFHADIKKISDEGTQLLTNLNEVVRADVRALSIETTDLIAKTSELVSDLSTKSKSINYLFDPLNFFKSRDFSTSSTSEDGKKNTPGIVEWLSRGIILVKLAKELVKNGK